MIRNCPKCGYTRKASDSAVPDWQCPSCGVAYAKYLEQTKVDASAPVGRVQTLSAPNAAPMSAKALFFILAGLVAVGYAGYDRFLSPKARDAGGDAGGVSTERGYEILQASNPAFYGTKEPGGPVLRMKPETSAALAQVAPGQVVMFATSWCPYCAKARALFAEKGVRYTEIDIEADARGADFQREVMGLGGVPTIVIGNRVTQGFDEGEILKGSERNLSVWKPPSVTVAAIVERDRRFLFVEELQDGRRVLNQPAGHLDPGESLIAACRRELMEETAHRYEPTGLVGIYRWYYAPADVTFLRFCFSGKILSEEKFELDREILALHWLTPAELKAKSSMHRSPLVQQCLDDHLAGKNFPLDVLSKAYG